jgi:hypothetical protein
MKFARWIVTTAAIGALCRSAFAELESPDALLAREADYCVIASGTGDGLIVRWLVFGDAGWQQLRADHPPKLQRGKSAVLFLSQTYDSIGAIAVRPINRGEVETVSIQDWPASFRSTLPRELANSEVLPKTRRDYVIGVQTIAAKARAERVDRADKILRSIVNAESQNWTEEYQRINHLADIIVREVHSDDARTLQAMARFVVDHPAPLFSSVRGQFASRIAAKYFRPGFDAVRAEAFRNRGDTWFSEQAALEGLGRIGNERDLARLRAQSEQIITRGEYRLILGDLFVAMGQLSARCYPEGSQPREQWRKWFEGFCVSPPSGEIKEYCRGYALRALHFVGNAETKALLQSRIKPGDPMTLSYQWAIDTIDTRLSRPK